MVVDPPPEHLTVLTAALHNHGVTATVRAGHVRSEPPCFDRRRDPVDAASGVPGVRLGDACSEISRCRNGRRGVSLRAARGPGLTFRTSDMASDRNGHVSSFREPTGRSVTGSEWPAIRGWSGIASAREASAEVHHRTGPEPGIGTEAEAGGAHLCARHLRPAERSDGDLSDSPNMRWFSRSSSSASSKPNGTTPRSGTSRDKPCATSMTCGCSTSDSIFRSRSVRRAGRSASS